MKNKFLLLFLFSCATLAANINSKDSITDEQARQWIGTKPVSFIENKGQMTDMNGNPVPSVLFYAEAPGMNIYITEKGLTYAFIIAGEDEENEREEKREKDKPEGSIGEKIEVKWERIDMNLNGATIKKENIITEDGSSEFSQYFLAHCPQGVLNVHSFKKIIIKNVYPGIDWVIYSQKGNTNGFKYDFLVHPHADANQIELIYSSRNKLNLDNDIAIKTKYGTFSENAPVSYQGENKIGSSFIKTSSAKNEKGGFESHIKFAIDNYNAGEILTIDPQLNWSTFYGGNSYEGPLSIACDASGNIFVTGYTTTTANFPLQTYGSAFYQGVHGGGNEDVFILKFTNNGALLWSTFYGGTGWEAGRSITVVPSGDICITGVTHSPNFPTQSLGGAYNQSVFGTGEDAYILKFSTLGVRLWATFYGGSASAEDAHSICTNPAGDIFITGWCGPNLPVMNPGGGAYFQGTTLGGFDMFLSKFNSAGALVWGTYYGGTQNDQGGSVCTDASGNIFIVGKTNSTNFPVQNAFQPTNAGGVWDGFILKFNNTGTLVLASYFGGNFDDRASTVAADNSGNVFVVGQTGSFSSLPLVNPGGGAYFQGSIAGVRDIFIFKMNSAGTLVWSTYYGGGGADELSDYNDCNDNLIIDANNNVYISFGTGSVGLPALTSCSGGYSDATHNGGIEDSYIAEFTNTGIPLWATYFGGDGTDFTQALALDNTGTLFVSGEWTDGNGGPVTTATYPLINPGGGAYFDNTYNGTTLGDDIYVAKFVPANPLLASVSSTPAGCSANNGTATVTVSGGTGPYTYSWSPTGGNGATATNLAGGSYTCTITDANGCIQSVNVTVASSSGPTVFLQSQQNVLCNGGNSGTATVNPSGGTSPYTYAWSPIGGTAITGTGLTAGNYTCTITDATGCTTTQTVAITQPSAITASATSTPTGCSASTGTATVSASGGTGAFTYNWAPSGGTAATANNLSAGSYTCTITDANGCIQSANVTVASSSGPTVFLQSQQNVLCNGGNSGTATVNPSGGTSPYTYSWSPIGGTGITGTGLTAGNYTCTITDATGCIATQTVAITQPSAITASATSTPSGCSASTGTATVSASGGGGSFTYNWAPSGGTAATANNLSAGSYTCTVTDANGCTQTASTTVAGGSNPTSTLFSQTNVLCNGGNTGSATVNPSGGTSPYTYSWSPIGGAGITGTGLTAGNYTCTITDASGCTVTQTVLITEPSAISASATSTPTGCSSSTGTATVSASGGTGTLTYNWSPSGGTGTTANNLASGSYTCTITDSNGCTQTASTTVTGVNSPSSILQSQTDVLCNGGNTGTATVSASGGTSPYTYAWSPIGGTAATGTGLTAGSYTCTITDAAGCTVIQTVNITEPPVITANASATPTGCSTNTGTATVIASGGTGSFTYNWLPSGGTSATANNLSAGVYTVTITDANGCTQTANANVTSTGGPTTGIQSSADVTCFGGTNGSGTISASGNGPFTYLWSPSGGTAASATNLAAGIYSVTVTDINNCVAIQTITITEPTQLVSNPTFTSATCGNSNGTADAVASGGTGVYTYSWSPSGGTNATANNLAAGNYTCTITDANGCSAIGTVTITNPGAPTSTLQSFSNISCFGGTNGSATVNPSGGSAPYTYSWSPIGGTSITATGLIAGSYTCTITDAAGCIVTQTVILTQPTGIVLTSNAVSENCNGGDGSASASTTGGTPGYTYVWSNASTNDSISNLVSGTYSVIVTDANGCTATSSVIVGNTGTATANAGTSVTIIAGQTVQLNGTGGVSYSWSPPTGLSCATCQNPIASPTVTTTYILTVTDANGCTDTDTITVTVDIPCGEVYLPNAFSPNGDGANDVLYVRGKCIKYLDFQIYNRWGEQVFYTTDANLGWDGTWRGINCETAVFTYVLRATLTDDSEINMQGNISLVK